MYFFQELRVKRQTLEAPKYFDKFDRYLHHLLRLTIRKGDMTRVEHQAFRTSYSGVYLCVSSTTWILLIAG